MFENLKAYEGEWLGKKLSLETGKIARQANGSVLLKYEDTSILVAVVADSQAKEDLGFLPLFCDYREKTYAAGMIPGGFFKREGRPSTAETLISRIMDRPIRPLFPEGFSHEVQVYATVLSFDPTAPSDVMALNAASLALCISDVPFQGPIGAVRVCHDGEKFIVNPSLEELENTILNIIVAGTATEIAMVEGGASEVSEELMIEAFELAHKHIKEFIEVQIEFAKGITRPKMESPVVERNEELFEKVRAYCLPRLKELTGLKDKLEFSAKAKAIGKEIQEQLAEEYPEQAKKISGFIHDIEKEYMRKTIADTQSRIDGRALNEIRPITSEVKLLPRAHGSALFTRGQTQALGVLTLGSGSDEQIIDGISGEGKKKFMLHYNFPCWSVGECGFPRSAGRREIGHGHLAETALKAVLPSHESFPYTIRLVSEITESNGSSSMATVCSCCLSLMDGGVPIKAPVAGIAMGLIKEEEDYIILSDIQGLEDHHGDMDFKVAGTKDGITAIQMDIKIDGLPIDVMRKALAQAKDGRMFILGKMDETLTQPKEEMSEFAPKVKTVQINPSKIASVIGPSGKVIKQIVEETGAKIDIEDDGRVFLFGTNGKSVDEAARIIGEITADVKVGEIYKGRVAKITTFGCFVDFLRGKSGLVHISELDNKRVKTVEDYCKVGDEMMVKIIKIDEKKRLNLSRKAAMKDLEAKKNDAESTDTEEK